MHNQSAKSSFAQPCIILIFFSIFVSDTPQSILSLGSSLNGSAIKEGDDVYFECNVRANPRPYKVTWRFNVSSGNIDTIYSDNLVEVNL